MNEDFARLYSPGESVVGRRFRRGDKAPWVEVVGVVGSLRRDGRDAELTPQIYLPAAQTGVYPVRLADVAVRGNGGTWPRSPPWCGPRWRRSTRSSRSRA